MYETKVTRGIRGDLEALTKIPLGDADNHVLHISTHKCSSGVICSAQAVIEDGGTISYVIFQDYNKRLFHETKVRATEKNIRDIHARALVGIDAVVAEAKKQYAVATV